MSSIKGFTFRGKLEDFTNNKRVQMEHATLSYKGPSKMGLDVITAGHYIVGSGDRVAEAGSTDSLLVLTGHDMIVGDLIRLKTTSNTIQELEIGIVEIIDANTVRLDGVLSAELSAADTFDIMRAVTQRFDSTGAQITSQSGTRIKVNSGAGNVDTDIVDDLITPANSVPMPVRLYGVTGNVNITAGDINVQTSHAGAGHDSLRIGDGTNLLAINGSLEATVSDADSLAQLVLLVAKDFATETTQAAMSAKLPLSLGQKAMAASLAVTIASDQSAIDVNNISGTISLPTGASTSALQTTSNTKLDTLIAKDFSTETSLLALSAKFASLGQKPGAGSAPVVLSTEQEAIIDAIKTAVESVAGTVAGSELQVDLVSLGGAATEATLAAQSAKLPAALGQANKAASLSVTLASDQEAVNTNLTIVDFLDTGLLNASSTPIISTSNGLEIVSSTAATIKKIQILEDIGEFMTLQDGATILAYLPLGGGEIEVTIAASTTLSLKSQTGGSISSGSIAINFLG